MTEFFIKRQGQADTHIKLVGYDLPIANGHKVAMVAASSDKKEGNFWICYCNLDLKRNTTLSDNVKSLKKKEIGWFGKDDWSFELGLKDMLNRIRI